MELNQSGTNQHYVPQLLLRRFLLDGQSQLHVYDKVHGVLRKTYSTKSIASEHGFDDVEVNGKQYSVDPAFKILEDQTGPIISKIVSAGTLIGLSANERKQVSQFVAAQYFRVKKHRYVIASFDKGIDRELRSRGIDPESAGPKATPNDIKRLAITQMADQLIPFSKYLAKMPVILQKAPPGFNFYISDNPVTYHNRSGPVNHRPPECNPYFDLFMPISREYSLWFVSEHYTRLLAAVMADVDTRLRRFEILPDRFDIEHAAYRALTTGNTLQIRREYALDLNALQVYFASRYLYSADGNFELAEKMIETHPSLSELPGLIFGDNALRAAQREGHFLPPKHLYPES